MSFSNAATHDDTGAFLNKESLGSIGRPQE